MYRSAHSPSSHAAALINVDYQWGWVTHCLLHQPDRVAHPGQHQYAQELVLINKEGHVGASPPPGRVDMPIVSQTLSRAVKVTPIYEPHKEEDIVLWILVHIGGVDVIIELIR